MARKQENKDDLQELKQDIRNKTPGRLYFFYGEESFLLQHYLQQLRKVIVDELTESFNFHKLTTETFDIRSFADCVENLPMMAERTMVLVDEIDIYKLHEAEREAMVQILSDIPDYCTVVFTYVATPFKPDKRMKKLWDATNRHGRYVVFAKQSQRDLIAWITRHFAANGKRIRPELCAYLIDLTGGSMTTLSGEIHKICAYSGSDDIQKSDIDAVTEPVMEAVVFQMTDLMSQSQHGKALLKLRQLIQLQEDPIKILGAIGNHFRRLSTARLLLDHGKNAEDLMRLTGMQDYPARKTVAAAKQFPVDFYAKASQLILETDRQLKTSYDDPVRLMEMLVLRLAQEASDG